LTWHLASNSIPIYRFKYTIKSSVGTEWEQQHEMSHIIQTKLPMLSPLLSSHLYLKVTFFVAKGDLLIQAWL
jgi:hypothetical protein